MVRRGARKRSVGRSVYASSSIEPGLPLGTPDARAYGLPRLQIDAAHAIASIQSAASLWPAHTRLVRRSSSELSA